MSATTTAAKKRKALAGMEASALKKAVKAYSNKRKASNSQPAKAARKVLNSRTGGFVGMELKFIDYGLVSQAILAPTDAAGAELDPGTVNCLNAIAQGDGESNRDGRQIVMKQCYVTGIINIPIASDQADLGSGHTFFLALVLDKQTNGAQLNSEDVYTNPGAAALTAANPLRDLQYTSRFQVLDSWQGCVGAYEGAGTDGASTNSIGGIQIPFKLNWQGECPVNFTNTTANVSTIQDNSLHVVGFASSVSRTPTVCYNSRVRFVG